VRSATVQLGHAEIEHDGALSRAALDEAAALAGCRVLSVRAERRLPALGEAPPEP
jgi:cob(I)alamin adenosyltransferase